MSGVPWWFWLLLAAGSIGVGFIGSLIANRIMR